MLFSTKKAGAFTPAFNAGWTFNFFYFTSLFLFSPQHLTAVDQQNYRKNNDRNDDDIL